LVDALEFAFVSFVPSFVPLCFSFSSFGQLKIQHKEHEEGICGRPLIARRFERAFDRIACIHMSGLCVRPRRALAKMGFAGRAPITKTISL
jgi:hypothetical protein